MNAILAAVDEGSASIDLRQLCGHRFTADFNGADALVRMLQLSGVRHIFGLCGDTSLPFYDALARIDHGIDHILTRDEHSRARGGLAEQTERQASRAWPWPSPWPT